MKTTEKSQIELREIQEKLKALSERINRIQKEKLQTQKGITIHHSEIDKADHFFQETIPDLMETVDEYLDMRLQPTEA